MSVKLFTKESVPGSCAGRRRQGTDDPRSVPRLYDRSGQLRDRRQQNGAKELSYSINNGASTKTFDVSTIRLINVFSCHLVLIN